MWSIQKLAEVRPHYNPKPITKGEAFTEENLTVKRPSTGISPMRWDELLQMKASRDFAPNELIYP